VNIGGKGGADTGLAAQMFALMKAGLDVWVRMFGL